MASPELEDQLQRLTVNESYDAESLPFRPPPGLQRENEFDEIPRYLFRVFTPRSQGTTTLSWVKSMEATHNTADSKVDIFAQADSREIAQMINRHLRWWEGKGDNLVSWTSSLLFALVYIFHLRANERDGSAFEQIHMCIIDTSTFPEGVFLRDLDLVRCYRAYDQGHKSLSDFEGLRLKKHESFSGHYYFGEYLSQGALKIESKCQIVSAQTLMDRGLFRIRSEFEHFAGWTPRAKPPWAKPVIELRESFYISKTERPGISEERLQAALHISRLFEPPWRLAMAANLIALAPPRMDDRRFLAFLRPDAIAGSWLRAELGPSLS